MGGGGEEQPRQGQLGHVAQVVGHDLPVRLFQRLQQVDDVPDRPAAGALGAADGVGDHQRGLRHLLQRGRQQHPDDVHRQELAVLGGQHPRLVEGVGVGVGGRDRLGDHLERVERAGVGAGQVDVVRDLGQLGQLGEPGQGTGGIHDHRRDAPAYRLVGDLTQQHRLAGTQPADHRDQAGGLADLGGVVGVEHDRPPRRSRRVADVGAAAVADLGGRRRQTGGDVEGGQPPTVRRGRHRLAGDELAQQRVLPLGVLDRDPPAAVGRGHLADPLQALGLGRAPHRQPEPAMDPRGGRVGSAGHLVLDLAGVRGLPVQGEGLVEVVLGVVALHVAHHQQLALDRLPRLATGEHVELRRPLDGERQPVGVAQPRLVRRVGRVHLLQPAHRQHRDVPLDASPRRAVRGPGWCGRAAWRRGRRRR